MKSQTLDLQTQQRSLYTLALAPLVPVLAVLSALRLYISFALEAVVHYIQGSRARRRKNVYLQGNYAPQYRESHFQELSVEGEIPKALNGVFMRTGPNPYFTPLGDYHWFDGDGMLHACRIKDGKVTYCNRYLETFKLAQEAAVGFPTFSKLGDLRGWSGLAHLQLKGLRELLGLNKINHGQGLANTALVYHAKKVMSLHEGDLPYAARILCNGLIESLGRVEFDGKVNHPFTAHPKLDSTTGELFFIGYNLNKSKSSIHYAGMDPQGNIMFDQRIALPNPVMHHDFAITQDYALLVHHCLESNGENMVKQSSLPFATNYGRNARIGVLPKRPASRSDQADVRWFELPQPLVVFHVFNAWQEGEVIRLFLCFFDKFDLDDFHKSACPRAGEIWLNTRTGKSGLKDFSGGICGDFPRTHPYRLGQPTQYGYLAVMANSAHPEFLGCAKYDLKNNKLVGKYHYPGKLRGGEVFFVPSHTDVSKMDGEDDGYLVTYVYDEAASDPENGSSLIVYNAKTMSELPVAKVPIPQRVPYGFHAHHITEEEFQEQLKLPASVVDKFVHPLRT